ncbi:MAG: exo-alpha-sialidase [Planctomycetaceae bacterium]|nr:exo-alpha-sialidase [Planctomycetaceae bacterium]
MLLRVLLVLITSAASAALVGAPRSDAAEAPGVLVQEFLHESAPFPSCHASTIEETPAGLVAAYFGGSDEGNDDVGIWVSRQTGKNWSAPVEVANGVESPTKRYPCWNPVLYQQPGGPLALFYKVGPSPIKWWGMLITSTDNGQTWSEPRRLPDGILGPIKNKPVAVKGVLLCPSSTEHEGGAWKGHVERTTDLGQTWAKTESIADEGQFGVIQPTLLTHADGRLQMLFRAKRRQIAESWSTDGGLTWSALAATTLPNPNSGIDAVNLKDGRMLLVYNHTARGRSPLNVAISTDGKHWKSATVLETERGEFSYPAVICTADGHAHITYTWKRKKIRHVEIDPAQVVLKEIQ